MTLSGRTKVHELLKNYPFLEDFLAAYSPKFEMLKNRMARATIGRVATLRTAAGIASIDVAALLTAIADEIARQTGSRPEVEDATATAPGREARLQILKEIIADLHAGGDVDAARARFAEAVEDVEASEIAAMEEELIRGGLPVSEVQRLCDVHVGAFRQALDEHGAVEAASGHPIHTYTAANAVVTDLANHLAALARDANRDGNGAVLDEAAPLVERLSGLENHYQRKENQLFPLLERHEITGPSQVMWGVHDQIRAQLKEVRAAVGSGDLKAFADTVPGFVRAVVEMVYKEEKILFPLAMQTLTQDEWAEVRRGEDELGYVLASPTAAWPGEGPGASAPAPSMDGLLPLMTGELSLEQINLLLTHLPVDLSYVDEDDTVRFYSEGPSRIFPRSPAVIGRKVQKCHPPKSVHMVQDILDAFRAGTQSLAEFWIQLQGKFIHIQYLAIRDGTGAYRGCLEVSQDVTAVRALQGERRLLQWQRE